MSDLIGGLDRMSGDDVVDLTGDEDPTDEDGDIGVSMSLGDEIYLEGKKSQESSICPRGKVSLMYFGLVMDQLMIWRCLDEIRGRFRDCFQVLGTCGELDAFVSIPDEGDMAFLRKKVKEHPSDTYVFTMKMEILLEPTSNKLMVGKLGDSDVHTLEDPTLILEILLRRFFLRLNLPDHRSVLIGSGGSSKDGDADTSFQQSQVHSHMLILKTR
ncbi:hypothetical protein Tco_0060045 [Tanacetum coccineum]